MNLYTKVDTPAANFNIDYKSNLVFIGSCFADNISAQFAERKFHVLANPFGTVYNPVSLESQIKAITDGKVFGENDVFKDERCDGLWHCWNAHSSLSAHTREECIDKLNAATKQARIFLQKASVVFVTFGTAFVYSLKNSGDCDGNTPERVVANCHRQDPNLFTRRMISVDEAVLATNEIVASIRQLNPHARIVFTVSPLRHMSDGAHNNTLSKATLQLAINETEKRVAKIAAPSARNDVVSQASAGVYSRICETQQSCAPRNDVVSQASAGVHGDPFSVSYFPSYEIVMDELRDYRFYDSDMVHLSKTAEDYIFERMVETYCDDIVRKNIVKVEKFMKMANHRIVDANSPVTQEFRQKLAIQAKELEKQIPYLDLSREKSVFREHFNNT